MGLEVEERFISMGRKVSEGVGLVVGQMRLKEGVADKWTWKLDPSGLYIVRFAYKAMSAMQNGIANVSLNRFWNKLVPLNITCFVWKLAQDRISSKENLHRRGILQSSLIKCVGCLVGNKSRNCLFFECPLFSKVRILCLGWFGISSVLHCECQAHFIQFQGQEIKKGIKKNVWQVLWYAIVRCIWISRNN